MASPEEMMVLSAKDAKDLQKSHAAAVEKLLDPEKTPENLVGIAEGVKWKNAQPTGKPAILALVTQKIDEDELAPKDKIPAKINEIQTDVLAVGELFAGQAEPALEVEALALAKKVRPAPGGYSVGHKDITAGTLGTCVYDRLADTGGFGIPSRYYILSNNHVLANSNDANLGDPILQPGPYDGGTDPRDRIARLNRFIHITFDPPVRRPLHRNLVDAALAEGQFDELKREIHWVGHLQGWLKRNEVEVGMRVHKCGRTTNYSVGRITAVNATVDVNYGGGRIARFRDQIVTTNMSAGGDSGSIVATHQGNLAVGLLFAGSSVATILNQIQHVRSLLRIEIV